MEMMKWMFSVLIFFISLSVALANEPSDVQNSIKDLSSELASINQQIVNTYQAQSNNEGIVSPRVSLQQSDDMMTVNIPMASVQGLVIKNKHINMKNTDKHPQGAAQSNSSPDFYEGIINKMRALKIKYDKNPYIRITGFDINIGIPPSVSVAIEFKK